MTVYNRTKKLLEKIEKSELLQKHLESVYNINGCKEKAHIQMSFVAEVFEASRKISTTHDFYFLKLNGIDIVMEKRLEVTL